MPIREFKCANGHITERLLKMSDDRTETNCQSCNQTASSIVSLIAFTPLRYGDCTGKYGVNGFHDRGLGATYHNSMERDAIMKQKGLISWEEAGGDAAYDRYKTTQIATARGQDAYLETFDTVVSQGGHLKKAHELAVNASEIAKAETTLNKSITEE